MASSTVDRCLDEWLEPATVERSPEQHAQLRKAVSAMSKAVDSKICIEVAAAAHAQLSDTARGWMSERIREQDSGFSATAKDRLLSIIAGAVLVEVLETSNHPKRTLVALLIESARCTGLQAEVTAVHNIAIEVSEDVRRSVRKRELDPRSALKELTDQLSALTQPDPAAPDLATAVGALVGHDAALRKLAERLDQTNKQVAENLRLQDEELDTLWWSFGGLSLRDRVPWSSIEPAERRAVLSAIELRQLSSLTPSPPGGRALLARVLAANGDSLTTIGAVAVAAVEVLDDVAGLPEHRLTPITSSAREYQKLGGKDDTWKTVVDRTLGFDVNATISFLDAAEQVLRELDLNALY